MIVYVNSDGDRRWFDEGGQPAGYKPANEAKPAESKQAVPKNKARKAASK